jgi:hypothetical protein
MNRQFSTPTDVEARDYPPAGYLEYEARSAIVDLVRVYGFERARMIVAEILNDEAGGKRRGN